MTSSFPTSLDAFTNPAGTDNLNTAGVVHHTEHSDANDAIEALETKVGIDSSAVTSSLDYKVSTFNRWTGAAVGSDVIAARVTGDTVDRLVVNADGTLEWGPGNAAVDTNFYRKAANQLATDDELWLPWDTARIRLGAISGGSGNAGIINRNQAADHLYIGETADTGDFIIRGSGTTQITGDIQVDGATQFLGTSGLLVGYFVEGNEISDPTAPAADKGRLYFKDNGAGKTQLAVIFNTGPVQVIATEP